MALALPKFRWLVIGAIAAGVWVVREDMKGPRPPERVPPAKTERSAQIKPRPPKPLAGRPAQPKQTEVAKTVQSEPVPPKPVPQSRNRSVASRRSKRQRSSCPGPSTVRRQSRRRSITGSITRPTSRPSSRPRRRCIMRAQAKADAPIIATLGPRTVMRELARSGEWRLVHGRRTEGLGARRLSGAADLPAAPAETAGRRKSSRRSRRKAGQGSIDPGQKALKVSVVSERTMPGTLATCSLMNLPMSSSVSM